MGSPARTTRPFDQACYGRCDQRVRDNRALGGSARCCTDLIQQLMVTSMTENDPFDLSRFVAAQDLFFETVLAELRAGRKQSDWMWFIFPHLRSLGRSPRATFYGIGDIEEARAYLITPSSATD